MIISLHIHNVEYERHGYRNPKYCEHKKCLKYVGIENNNKRFVCTYGFLFVCFLMLDENFLSMFFAANFVDEKFFPKKILKSN